MAHVKMARYKRADFQDDDNTSVGSVQVCEGVTSGTTHIRYHPGSTLWKSRNTLEKLLFVFCFLLLIIIIILSVLLGSANQQNKNMKVHILLHEHKESDDVCLTTECVKVSASILTAMDTTVEPCDNFYEYACGGWIKNNPIPDGKSMWGTFGKLWQQNQIVMKNVLEKPYNELASDAERKGQLYYQSCLDVNETLETLGAKPMVEFIKKVGGWNITDSDFSVNEWNLQTTIMTLQNKYNMGGMFSWAVGEDDKNSSRHVIQIDQGGLTLPTRDYYMNKTVDNDEVLKAYLDYMTQIGVLLGGEENSTRHKMQLVVEFETRLAEITTPADQRRDEEKLYHSMTMTQLDQTAPFMSWKSYFQDAFSNIQMTLPYNITMVVYAPDYLMNLNLIIKEYSRTSEGKNTLNNYLIWSAIRTLNSCLSKAFRDAEKMLRKALTGSTGGEEPWRSCVTDTNNVMGFALGAMFVREVFHGDAKPMAEEMINAIRKAFKRNLKNLAWMDPETRKSAQSKADAITDMIGFPDYILHPSELDKKYEPLDIKVDEYFENNIRINQYSLKKNLEKLNEPVNKTRWGMTPPTVNAYYTPTKNQIVFPAGILQEPFYDTNYPRSLNFGAMGVVMGHELTHAFDDQGREYDKFGNLHQWWNNKTISRFNERVQCIVDQYGNFSVNGKNINGKQTLGENIADNGGLKASFRAYASWVKEHHEEIPLPGVNLTHKQLFFLGFAQVWCSASTSEAIHLQLLNDPHSPAEFRVRGPLFNSVDFAREFNCPTNTRMNPKTKCEVW